MISNYRNRWYAPAGESVLQSDCRPECRAASGTKRRDFRRRDDAARPGFTRASSGGCPQRARPVAHPRRAMSPAHHVHDEFSHAWHFLGRSIDATQLPFALTSKPGVDAHRVSVRCVNNAVLDDACLPNSLRTASRCWCTGQTSYCWASRCICAGSARSVWGS